ncbi:hypothetical protein OHS59_30435 [Streptomyces sp. NBC_00414]|uniref:hypothetical protein n=1 Tax=Streptomyces sp. NBC_00414 TaxID=2975739 RepID=UPI002E224D0C
MHIRNLLGGVGIGAALILGTTAFPAAAAAPAAVPPAAASTAAEPSAVPLYWVNTGETFNRLAPCDTRGSWYWDNYSNVYSWDCRWSGSTYKLWLQKG